MNRLFLFALFAVFAGGCARSDLGERAASEVVKSAVEGEVKKTKTSIQKVGSIEVDDSRLVGSDAKGNKLWEVRAKFIEAKDKGTSGDIRRATLTEATVKIYHQGQLESTFGAPLVEFFKTDDGLRLAMTKGVRASNVGALGKDGVPIAISAPRGDVDVAKRVATLSGGARVVRGATTVTGQTLRTQTDLARSMMSGDVVAVSTQQNTSGKMQASDATFAWKANKLAANGVTFTRPDLTLSGDKLSADTAAEKGTLSGDVRAKTPDSSATAPSVDFDWKADLIRAPHATLARDGAQMQTAALQTDSKLKVASARDVTIRQGDAILKAASARGFSGLTKLSGQGVTIVRDGLTLSAARAIANDWSATSGTVKGEGGVVVTNAQSRIKAPTATWSGGENGNIVASGGVEIVADGTTIRGARGTSDAKFQTATLSGDVRANLKDGATLRAPQVRKSGDDIVATGGTTAQFMTDSQLGQLTMKAPRVETTIGGQSARASGGVKLKSASGATATAPTATFNRATQKIVTSGPVTYNDPQRGTITGKSLKADLRLQSAEILGARGQSTVDLFGEKGLFD